MYFLKRSQDVVSQRKAALVLEMVSGVDTWWPSLLEFGALGALVTSAMYGSDEVQRLYIPLLPRTADDWGRCEMPAVGPWEQSSTALAPASTSGNLTIVFTVVPNVVVVGRRRVLNEC